jgi:hypothetical protein
MSVNKLIAAIVGTVLFTLQGALTDGGVNVEEAVTIGAAVLAAFGAWLVPNTAALATAKTWVNAVVLGAGVLLPLLVGGVDGSEWMTVGIAVLTAAGVYAVPNKTPDNRDMRLAD